MSDIFNGLGCELITDETNFLHKKPALGYQNSINHYHSLLCDVDHETSP